MTISWPVISDIGRGFGHEKRDSCSDFVGTAGAADRGVIPSNNFVRVGGSSLNPAWRDSVHRNTLAGQLKSAAAREPDHASFGRTVCSRDEVERGQLTIGPVTE